MYAWKCWRDTRRIFLIYLALLLVIGTACLTTMFFAMRSQPAVASPEKLWTMGVGVPTFVGYLCAVVMAFAIGSHNVGADIGKGSADFLLTRPRTRRYFVWTGWAVGLAEVLLLVVVSAAVTLTVFTIVIGPVWRRLPSPMHVMVEGHVLEVPALFVPVVLTAVVLYGLTYFLTVVFRSGQRGVLASLATVFAYFFVSAMLRSLAGVALPGIKIFAGDGQQMLPLHALGVPITGWLLVALAFPVASQFVLNRYQV